MTAVLADDVVFRLACDFKAFETKPVVGHVLGTVIDRLRGLHACTKCLSCAHCCSLGGRNNASWRLCASRDPFRRPDLAVLLDETRRRT